MSQETIEAAREGYSALEEQDLERFLTLLDEDVELHELADAPDSDVYRGHSGVRGWWEERREAFADFRFEIEELRDLDGAVLARVRARGVGRGGGAPFEQRVFHILDFRNGLVWRMRGFLKEDEALEAARVRD